MLWECGELNEPVVWDFDAGHFAMFLNALKSNQMAKLLAEPNLMTLDGQPAQFIAGGEFPSPSRRARRFRGHGGRHRQSSALRNDLDVPASDLGE